MTNIYNQDDRRMDDFDVKRSLIVIDNEKKRVFEYIYMIEKGTGKECVKRSMMYGGDMLNAIKTATYKEYLGEYVEFVSTALCIAEEEITEQEAINVAIELKEIEEKVRVVIAQDTDGVDMLTGLIDFKM